MTNLRFRRPRRGPSLKSLPGAGSRPTGSPPPRAICFDLDGVLIDTMPLHARAWQDALARRGLKISRRAIYEWEGEPGGVSARKLLSQRGARPTEQDIAALLHDKEQRFQRLARHIRVPKPLLQMLERLKRRGIRLALVTGTSSGEVRRVVPVRARRAFRTVITGDRVRPGKPHPKPYRTAMRLLGVPRARVWVVENAPYGIRSARRAGAGRVIALASSLPPRYLHEAHVVVRSLDRLVGLLNQA